MAVSDEPITVLIQRVQGGDATAREHLVTRLYPALRRMAARKRAAHVTSTLLDTYGLLHEALERMLRSDLAPIEGSGHLMAYAANVMRSVIVDHARRKNADKRDGGERVTWVTGVEMPGGDRVIDLLALDEALRKLTQADERLTRVVEMRCFAGMEIEAIAVELGLSPRTVLRDWQRARAFLKVFLKDEA
jgi:RNA polymerase sigma factor (TIGR02999 family)